MKLVWCRAMRNFPPSLYSHNTQGTWIPFQRASKSGVGRLFVTDLVGDFWWNPWVPFSGHTWPSSQGGSTNSIL